MSKTVAMRGLDILLFLIFFSGISACRAHKPVAIFCAIADRSSGYVLDNWRAVYEANDATAPIFHYDTRGNDAVPEALIQGACPLGLMSRLMSEQEISRIKKTWGQEPLRLILAHAKNSNLYAYTIPHNKQMQVQKFLEMALSPRGQKILPHLGFRKLTERERRKVIALLDGKLGPDEN